MLIKDSLGQEIGVGDILMLSFSYTNRCLEPALLIKVSKTTRISNADFVQVTFLFEDSDPIKISEHVENTFTRDNSEVWIETGIKIHNPEFFLSDKRISKLMSERPAYIK